MQGESKRKLRKSAQVSDKLESFAIGERFKTGTLHCTNFNYPLIFKLVAKRSMIYLHCIMYQIMQVSFHQIKGLALVQGEI